MRRNVGVHGTALCLACSGAGSARAGGDGIPRTQHAGVRGFVTTDVGFVHARCYSSLLQKRGSRFPRCFIQKAFDDHEILLFLPAFAAGKAVIRSVVLCYGMVWRGAGAADSQHAEALCMGL